MANQVNHCKVIVKKVSTQDQGHMKEKSSCKFLLNITYNYNWYFCCRKSDRAACSSAGHYATDDIKKMSSSGLEFTSKQHE